MKKISIVIFVFVLTACAVGRNDIIRKGDSDEGIEGFVGLKFEKCETLSEESQKNECLYDYISREIYYRESIDPEKIQICEKLKENNRYREECFWLFAMKTKDKEICKKIQHTPEEEHLFYITPENCENSIKYDLNGANWELESGFPPNADPEDLRYVGNAKIRGWIVLSPIYVGDPVKQFKVHPDDLQKLPPTFQDWGIYQLKKYFKGKGYEDVDKILIDELDKHTEENPATIEITEIFARMEGTPLISVEGVVAP